MHVEHLIIGAGPAGIQLGLFFKKRHRDFKIIERNDRSGSFFEEYPRHRTLLSINKVYTGYPDRESQLRYDWNSLLVDEAELQFTRYSQQYFRLFRVSRGSKPELADRARDRASSAG